jgi:uncharacterized protein (TIGR03437 family)
MRPLCLLLLSALLLSAAEYRFTKIYDNGPDSPFRSTDKPIMINNRGQVVFTTERKSDGLDGVFMSDGSAAPVALFIETSELRGMTATGLNDNGTVVFTTGPQIYTIASGGTPQLVAEGDPLEPINGLSLPAINSAGTVAWTTFQRVYLKTGAGPVRIAVSNTDLPRQLANGVPRITGVHINSSETVSLFASGVNTPSSLGIYTRAVGAMPQLEMATVPPLLQTPINDAGTVVVMTEVNNKPGLYLGRQGTVSAAVTFKDLESGLPWGYSINNRGDIVFYGSNNASSNRLTGIFAGPDFVRDKVIAVGDPLFGSTVATLFPYPTAGRTLNDLRQVVFNYLLANGLFGVAVATPVSAPTGGLPSINNGGILNGASFQIGGALSPGTVAAIFGENLASALVVADTPVLPTTLGSVQVLVNGTPAPIFFVSTGQVNIQVPYGLTGTTAEIRVVTLGGTSASRTVPVASQTPAIYTAGQNGSGQAIAVHANTASLVAAIGLTPDSRPARPGDVITIYATGLGEVTPALGAGFNSCTGGICLADFSNLVLRNLVVRPTVDIGGIRVPDADIFFAGLAPQYAGLYQINLRVPAGIQAGNRAIVIRQGANTSPANVFIGLQ